jgi:myo-inositol-1(or 4)-monophosphatase
MGGSEFLDTAVEAARRAEEVMLRNLGTIARRDIGKKQASDFVTRIDRECEEVIVGLIRNKFPEHSFLAEESMRDSSKAYRWIIDPLDGTTNYIHQYPIFSVSIALEVRAEVVLGVVLDPMRGELFHAEKGKGAFLNGMRVKVSSMDVPASSLITTGFPFRSKHMIDHYLAAFKKIFLVAGDLRRAGSAALDLAYLGAGRCEGFFELGLSAWDIAAGGIIIREAGGVITDFSGGDEYLETGNVVAGTPAMHPKILDVIKETFKGVIDK